MTPSNVYVFVRVFYSGLGINSIPRGSIWLTTVIFTKVSLKNKFKMFAGCVFVRSFWPIVTTVNYDTYQIGHVVVVDVIIIGPSFRQEWA